MQHILSQYKFHALPRRVFVCVCGSVYAISFSFTTLHHSPISPSVVETRWSYCAQAAMWSSRTVLTQGWPGLLRLRRMLEGG